MTNPTTPPTPEERREILDPMLESAQTDAARRLAEQGRSELRAEGHSDEQIRGWAEAYVSEDESNTDLPGFLDWVAHRA